MVFERLRRSEERMWKGARMYRGGECGWKKWRAVPFKTRKALGSAQQSLANEVDTMSLTS